MWVGREEGPAAKTLVGMAYAVIRDFSVGGAEEPEWPGRDQKAQLLMAWDQVFRK